MLKLTDQDSQAVIKIQEYKWKYDCNDEQPRGLSRKTEAIKICKWKF